MGHLHVLGTPPRILHMVNIYCLYLLERVVRLLWGRGDHWYAQSLIFPQLVMRYWETTPRGPVLWEARAEPWATWVPLLCFVLHVVSWLLIFSILLVFDYAELMGLKQVRIPHPYLRLVSASLSFLDSSDFSRLCSASVFLQLALKESDCRSPGLEGGCWEENRGN